MPTNDDDELVTIELPKRSWRAILDACATARGVLLDGHNDRDSAVETILDDASQIIFAEVGEPPRE